MLRGIGRPILALAVVACSGPVTSSPADRTTDPASAAAAMSVTLTAAPNVFTVASAQIPIASTTSDSLPQSGVVWTTDNPSVAQINQDGEIVGRAPGSTLVRTSSDVNPLALVRVIPQSNDTAITIIAHRGFMRRFPENTLVAVNGAFNNGADAVEVDVRLSSDRVPVIMHDETVDRTTNGRGPVQSLSAAQLTALNACAHASGTWPPCALPTVAEVLAAAHGKGGVLLHLYGSYTADDLRGILKIIHESGMDRNTVFICFDYPTLKMIRELDSVVPLGFLSTGLASLDQVDALGRAAALPELQAALSTASQSTVYLSQARGRRLDAAVWVVYDQTQARAAVALGFRHLISDVPLDRASLVP